MITLFPSLHAAIVLRIGGRKEERSVPFFFLVPSRWPLEPKRDLSSKASGSTFKKKRDPTEPRKSLSAFRFFCLNEGENLDKTNPGISFMDMSRLLVEKWRNMSAEEKEPYEAKARVHNKRIRGKIPFQL